MPDASASIIERARAAREAAAAQLAALREQTSLPDVSASPSSRSSIALEVESVLTRALKAGEDAAIQVPDVKSGADAAMLEVPVQVPASDNFSSSSEAPLAVELSVSSEDSEEASSSEVLRDRARKARQSAAAQLQELAMAEEKDKAWQAELERRRVSLAEKRAKRQSLQQPPVVAEAPLAEAGHPLVVA